MLGLGGSLMTSGVVSEFHPQDIAGLDLWLQFNKGIVGADGGASDDGDMADGEDIVSWADQSGNGRNGYQGVVSRRPHWETDAADIGGLRWTDDTADPSFQLGSNVDISANEDFTIMVRVKLTDFSTTMSLLGSSSKNTLKWASNSIARVIIFGAGDSVFEEASDTLATDTYYVHTLTRSGGASGNLELRIHGGSHDDKSWDAAENHTDAEQFVINNIGTAATSAIPVEGVFKDVMIWKGVALSTDQRAAVVTYMNAQ